jgi:hypothetical protein
VVVGTGSEVDGPDSDSLSLSSKVRSPPPPPPKDLGKIYSLLPFPEAKEGLRESSIVCARISSVDCVMIPTTGFGFGCGCGCGWPPGREFELSVESFVFEWEE